MKINFRVRRIVHEFTESYRKVIGNNLQGDEMIEEFEKDITRIQLSTKKRRGNMTPQKFYKDVVKGDSIIKRAYRSYKLEKVSSLKAADIRESLLG